MLTNLFGMENILRHALEQGSGTVMYISSSEVYGIKEENTPYCENEYGSVDLLDPRSCYPSSKRAAETLCVAYSKQYGIDTRIVRPGHIYGPTATAEDNRASSQFPRDVLAGMDIIMKSPGNQLRSYCYVLDCVSAMLAVLLRGETATAYNISNQNSVVTIRQMAQAFADAGGKRLLFSDPSHSEMAAFNRMSHSDLDAARLEALGWYGLFDLEAGVKATLDALN
jgi:nucleoside-diphosphate-sugar epimerase